MDGQRAPRQTRFHAAMVKPSPNAPNLWMARCYAGTVMLEGTTLSEGRGTTRPFELLGAPWIDAEPFAARLNALNIAGAHFRPVVFEPTFHKHAGKLCAGLHVHAEGSAYNHKAFRPWRLQALAFKAIRRLYPDYPLWRERWGKLFALADGVLVEQADRWPSPEQWAQAEEAWVELR